MVPQTQSGWFFVMLGWEAFRAAPGARPCVVLPLDVAIQDYDLRPLAGLDLRMVYSRNDAHRVQEVADCLLAIRPRTLCAHSIEAHGADWVSWHGRGETLLPGVMESWA